MKNNITQKIKGNDNIQQKIENQTVNVYSEGISEQTVREISANNARRIVQEYFIAAQDLADKRMTDFENIVIKRLDKLDDKFACFQDPSFNLSYRQAQIQAATTDNLNSYRILSELLVHRHRKVDNKNNQTGINGAINILEQVSDSTLTALTVVTCVIMGVKAKSKKLDEFLDLMERLYSSIVINTLPQDEDWIEQLDILNAIRINDFSKFNSFENIITDQYDGLICVGIKKNSENFKKASKLLEQIGFDILVENELKKGYYRLPIISKADIDSLYKNIDGISVLLSTSEKQIINEIFNLYDIAPRIIEEVKEKFLTKYDAYPHLKQIHYWWNSLKTSFKITIIGRVLGHANAQNCCPGFPPLD